MKYKYPLQSYPYSLLDRARMALFVLNKNNQLTQGPQVKKLESKFTDFAGSRAIATSSGSTANTLLFETFIQTYNADIKDVMVFCPSQTWASSITPAIMRGIPVKFVDINLQDFSFDYERLETAIVNCKSKYKIIFPTVLIGFAPDIMKLKTIAARHKCFLFGDVCEGTLTEYEGKSILGVFDMCTTSLYFAHQITGVECGVLFIKHSFRGDFYDNAILIRNHGLTRGLPADNENRRYFEKTYSHIDPNFLFANIGTNLRTSDIHAKYALLDFCRIFEYKEHRNKIWRYFISGLPEKYCRYDSFAIPFCLPIILKMSENYYIGEELNRLKIKVNKAGFETRPLICNLTEHPAFKPYVDAPIKYKNSQFLTRSSFYVGLSNKLKYKDIDRLLSLL